MKRMNGMICLSLLLIFVFSVAGCHKEPQKPPITDPDAFYRSALVQPFWLSDVMSEETVTMIQYNKLGDAYGFTGYIPKKIRMVTNYAKTETYVEGVDYTVEGNRIVKLKGSTMPHMNYSNLIGNSPLGLAEQAGYEQFAQYSSESYRKEGLYIYYNEYNSILTKNQILVTYEYDSSLVKSKASYQGDKLQKTIKKLQNGEDLRILIYGDSISYGCNASGYLKEPPYTKPWFTLLKEGLESKFTSTIELKNTSVGGTQSSWGAGLVDYSPSVKADLKKNVIAQDPDLVVVGFGMNDGAAQVSVKEYISNMTKILDDTRSLMKKDVEFIVLNTISPNPMSTQDTGLHEQYYKPLLELCQSREGCALVDMRAMQRELWEQKFYTDLLSNNINHPNDFYVRVYAMNLLSTLIKYE